MLTDAINLAAHDTESGDGDMNRTNSNNFHGVTNSTKQNNNPRNYE